MPVQITFPGDLVRYQGGVASLRGDVTVDYEANSASGMLSLGPYTSIPDENPQVFGNFSSFKVEYSSSTSSYTVTGVGQNNTADKVSFSYSGEQPERLSSLTSNVAGSDVTWLNGPVFSTYIPCFASGTRILTVQGEVKVEDLNVGDLVVTAAGELRPIRWIGYRHLDCARHPDPTAVLPLRDLANAFGTHLPKRDLYLSPDHAIRVSVLDEVLIPVKHLINDATIAQVDATNVTYWHVELDSHDILMAEGLPTESFLDTGVRAGFENGADHMALHPDFTPLTLDSFCRPLVQGGPIVDAVRTRLLARAEAIGWTITDENDLHVLADGIVIRPELDGAIARFTLPSDAGEVQLVSRSFVPERVRVGAGDGRRLGVPLRGLSVVDANDTAFRLPIDSDLLTTGFSHVQNSKAGLWRWTTGVAVLPNALWAGYKGTTTLVVETAPDQGALQAWVAPESESRDVLLILAA